MLPMVNANGSHAVPLLWALEQSEGMVVELGTGPCSTPLLHFFLQHTDRELVSFEEQEKFFFVSSVFAKMNDGSKHEIYHTPDVVSKARKLVECVEHVGVVLVDCEIPGEATYKKRMELAKIFLPCSTFVLVHDCEDERICGDQEWKEVVEGCTYAQVYNQGSGPNTLILSMEKPLQDSQLRSL